MHQKSSFILALTLLVSCRPAPNMEAAQEEVAVIHQTFEKAVTAVSKNDLKDLEFYVKRFRNDTSSLLSRAIHNDKQRFHLYSAPDSLFFLQSFSQVGLPINKEFVEKMDVDSLFASLIKSFGTTIKVKLKTKTLSYQILSKESLKENKNFNGMLKFSRVMFNKSRTKACYYFEQSILIGLERGWAMGTVVFAEKKNGKWVYLKDKYLFIT